MKSLNDPWLEYVEYCCDIAQRRVDEWHDLAEQVPILKDANLGFVTALKKHLALLETILEGTDDPERRIKQAYVLGMRLIQAEICLAMPDIPAEMVDKIPDVRTHIRKARELAQKQVEDALARTTGLEKKNAEMQIYRDRRNDALCEELDVQLKAHDKETPALNATLNDFDAKDRWSEFAPARAIDLKQFRNIARKRKIIPPAAKKK